MVNDEDFQWLFRRSQFESEGIDGMEEDARAIDGGICVVQCFRWKRKGEIEGAGELGLVDDLTLIPVQSI